eukprot:GHVS01021546.1.p1 GENE.GHVS01021546.1~~GHVS01021546.1.p1  ORF type:complete len:164 (+),score=29.10 GHVS01021546.1:57-494(+)
MSTSPRRSSVSAIPTASARKRTKPADAKPLALQQGVWRKAFHWQSPDELSEEPLWEKDEVCDFLHWMKLGIALTVGLLFGAIPVEGVGGLVVFGLVLMGLSYGWCRKAGITEDVMETSELLQEGTMSAVMGFVLMWTCVYTFLFF